MGVKSTTSKPKTGETKRTSNAVNNGAKKTNETDNTANKNDVKTIVANNNSIQASQLSEREKSIQKEFNEKGEVTVQTGDKVGNYARAIADKDGDGNLTEKEKLDLQAATKAILDKNPALASLAKERGLDPNNPDDLETIMQLQAEEAGLKSGEDTVKAPTAEDVEKAQKEIDEANHDLDKPENIDAPPTGANCNKPHEPDIISQISKLIQEAYMDLQKGDFQAAEGKFQQAISMGTEQLGREMNGSGQPTKQQGAIIDPANPEQLKQPGALNNAQQASALKTLIKNDQTGNIANALEKAKGNPRIQKLLDLIAYAQQGLERAKNKDNKGLEQFNMKKDNDPRPNLFNDRKGINDGKAA